MALGEGTSRAAMGPLAGGCSVLVFMGALAPGRIRGAASRRPWGGGLGGPGGRDARATRGPLKLRATGPRLQLWGARWPVVAV